MEQNRVTGGVGAQNSSDNIILHASDAGPDSHSVDYFIDREESHASRYQLRSRTLRQQARNGRTMEHSSETSKGIARTKPPRKAVQKDGA